MPPDDPKKPDPNTPAPDESDYGDGLVEVFRDIESDDEPEKKVEEPPA